MLQWIEALLVVVLKAKISIVNLTTVLRIHDVLSDYGIVVLTFVFCDF